ncbi:MAG: diacylglycerol/lipid kinase family protein, partial [Bacteroidota bacterium]
MQNNNNNKLLFVVNPISGDIDKKRFSIKVKKFSEELDFSFHLYETTGKNDAENIKNEIKSYKPNIVVAVGGDGTCNMVATILKNTRLSMGILPRGSANGMANELNLPDNLEESLKVFLENNVRTIDMLKINDEYFSMHLGDIG